MIKVGKINHLKILYTTPSGMYLDAGTGNRRDNILLPGKECSGLKDGDEVSVFIYHDSEDRLIATIKKPFAQVGELAYLKVTANTKVGSFLDLGLDRGLFLPFREQKYPIEVDKSYLVYLYLDKSGRLSCTTDIGDFLKVTSPYKKNDTITGTIYAINPQIGIFVAVDNLYQGLIPNNENFVKRTWGEIVQARVIRVREDGKLDLSPRNLAHEQMNIDGELLINAMLANGGKLPLNEKAAPEEIQQAFQMSKGAFKRAIGTLLKKERIRKEGDDFFLP
ncbi:MAG: RNA-binding protein [Desulfitobacterium sp.]|nr:RNA-binding protein [Desulfitobacterium sp.]